MFGPSRAAAISAIHHTQGCSWLWPTLLFGSPGLMHSLSLSSEQRWSQLQPPALNGHGPFLTQFPPIKPCGPFPCRHQRTAGSQRRFQFLCHYGLGTNEAAFLLVKIVSTGTYPLWSFWAWFFPDTKLCSSLESRHSNSPEIIRANIITTNLKGTTITIQL